MKLTAKKAVELSIELWEWLAGTGEEEKDVWPEWEENGGKYPEVQCHCFLCEYNDQQGGDMPDNCQYCPYDRSRGLCMERFNPYGRWTRGKTNRTRKKYAKLFLEQLKTILKEMEV